MGAESPLLGTHSVGLVIQSAYNVVPPQREAGRTPFLLKCTISRLYAWETLDEYFEGTEKMSLLNIYCPLWQGCWSEFSAMKTCHRACLIVSTHSINVLNGWKITMRSNYMLIIATLPKFPGRISFSFSVISFLLSLHQSLLGKKKRFSWLLSLPEKLYQ